MNKELESNNIPQENISYHKELRDSHWLAKRLGISYQKARTMGRENKVPSIRIGKLIRYDENIINRWIAENTTKPR